MTTGTLRFALLLAVVSGGIAAAAQDVAPPKAGAMPAAPSAATGTVAAPNDTGVAETTGLADIVVTAQRKTENLQRAAIAVSVVQGADLLSGGITRPEQLGELVPALTVQSSAAGNLFFIRGVGNFTTTANSDPATAFNYDGVYIGRPNSTNGKFFDLARIEVLKGPQGTLYGRNATGGAINVIPVQPLLGEWSGYGTVSYGNYNAVTAEGALNVPVGEHVAARISAQIVNRDGYLDDGTSDDKKQSVRAQVKGEITPSLTARLAADFSHLGGAGFGQSYVDNRVYSPATGLFTIVPSNIPLSAGLYTDASQAYRETIVAGTAGRTFDALAPYPGEDDRLFGLTGDVSLKTGIGTFTILPAWRHADLKYYQEAGGFLSRTDERDNQHSLEARLGGTRGPVDYILGAYYFDESILTQGPGGNLSTSLSYFNRTLYTTHSYAFFGRGTIHLTDRFRIVGGIRYTEDKKHNESDTDNLSIACTTRVAGVPSCPTVPLLNYTDTLAQQPYPIIPARGATVPIGTTGGTLTRRYSTTNLSSSSNAVTYHAGAEYDVARDSLLYASIETGYRSGGFNGAVGHEIFQPEYITAYTVGLKNRFLDRRLQVNIEGFYWKYRDQQISHLGIDAIGRAATFTENIGRSTLKGAELETRFLVTPTTLLSADLQYLDAKYDSFNYNVIVGAAGPPLTSCPVTPTGAPATFNVNCAGFQAYNSPKWTLNLAAQQTFKLGDYNLIAGVDTQYKTSQYIAFDYLPEELQPSYWITDVQLTYGPASDKWSVAAYVRNIEGNRVLVSSGIHPIGNILVSTVSAPRTFGVRGSVRF